MNETVSSPRELPSVGMAEVRQWPILVKRSHLREVGLTNYKISALVAAGVLHPVRLGGGYARFRREEVVVVLNHG